MFGQFIIVLFLVYHIVANFWMPVFLRFFTDDQLTIEFAITAIFELMLPGVLLVILGKIEFFLAKNFQSIVCFFQSILWIFSLLA